MTRTELMRQLRRRRVDVQERGDELKMNCPVCGDQRGRLFFNTVLQKGYCQNECGGFSRRKFYETFGIVDLDAVSRSDVAELLERELEPEPGTGKRKGPIGAPFPISSAVLVWRHPVGWGYLQQRPTPVTKEQAMRHFLTYMPFCRRHRFIGQNRKFDCHFLRVWCGVEDLTMDWDDTYVMAYLLNEDTTRGLKNLEALASIYCGLEANYKEKFLRDGLKVKLKKQADFWKVVSSEVLYLYCAADVWVTRRVRDALLDRLRLQPALLDLYYDHYLRLQSAIIEAERVGFSIDQNRAQQVNTRFTAECDRLIGELRDLADDPTFNVRSLPQLQTLLFDRWSLPQVDGRSTKEAVLETLLGDELLGTDARRFLKTLLEYRGVDKLRGTYCQGILDWRRSWGTSCWGLMRGSS